MQTGNSEVASHQCEGHATGLQVITCGFGGAEPPHGQTLAAAASRKGQGRRGTPVGMTTVHMNGAMCRKDAICRGWRVCRSPLLSYRSPQAAGAEALFIWVSVFQRFLKFVGFFPYSQIATYRSYSRTGENAFISVFYLFRADLHSYWIYRHQTRHEVTHNTCG